MAFNPDPKKFSEKKKPKGLKKTYEPTGDFDFFCCIWDNTDPESHISFISGISLERFAGYWDEEQCYKRSSTFASLFHHCLTKKSHPELRFYVPNVIYLTPSEHNQIHSMGKDRLIELNPNWQRYFALVEELKELKDIDYREFSKSETLKQL